MKKVFRRTSESVEYGTFRKSFKVEGEEEQTGEIQTTRNRLKLHFGFFPQNKSKQKEEAHSNHIHLRNTLFQKKAVSLEKPKRSGVERMKQKKKGSDGKEKESEGNGFEIPRILEMSWEGGGEKAMEWNTE